MEAISIIASREQIRRYIMCRTILISCLIVVGVMVAGQPSATAQFGMRREHAEIKRMRPADVHLANLTISVQIKPVDGRASHLAQRLKKLVANGVLNPNKRLREDDRSPQVVVDCSITKYDYDERTEVKKLLYVKEKGRFKIITSTIEASYKVVRLRDNHTYFADNVSHPYKKEFQEEVSTPPNKSEIEDRLMNGVVNSILARLNDTEETLKVRVMEKDELSRYTRLAQGNQWLQYVESISALPEKKLDKHGKSSFEGDRHYNMSIAYEALAYETMWKDYNRATKYFDLADSYIRKAQQFDPREEEYVRAQTRILEGKKYFETIKERFPGYDEVPESESGPGARDVRPPASGQPATPESPSGLMTNEDVIRLLKAGFSEEFITDQIRRAKTKRFDTSSKGLVQLRNAGASERLIRIMQDSMRKAPTRRPKRKKP